MTNRDKAPPVTIRIPANKYEIFKKVYDEYEPLISVKELDFAGFYRWCANEGLYIVEKKLRNEKANELHSNVPKRFQ